MGLSTLALAALAIAAAMAGLAIAIALPRWRARRIPADAQSAVPAPHAGASIAVVAAATGGILAMAFGFYAFFGDFRASPVAATASDAVESPASRAGLVRHLERSPNDGRAWVLLARMDFDADRYADAATAYERAIAASPKVTGDPGVWCEYADALGMAQGGSLAGRPRELVMRALAQNPAHPKALEMAGSAAFEAGEYAAAVQYWRSLLAQIPDGSREHRELAAAIDRAGQMVSVVDARPGAR